MEEGGTWIGARKELQGLREASGHGDTWIPVLIRLLRNKLQSFTLVTRSGSLEKEFHFLRVE
jgi:hypothetical protein